MGATIRHPPKGVHSEFIPQQSRNQTLIPAAIAHLNQDRPMSGLNLSTQDKQRVQHLIEEVQSLPQKQRDEFLDKYSQGRESHWYSFAKAIKDHPVTWWIGIFQLQMQMGIWGQKHKVNAQARASMLWQLSKLIRDEILSYPRTKEAPITSSVIAYCKKHHKAEFSGRLLGGLFTNFASTGGRAGKKVIPTSGHIAIGLTNFLVASYGAAIKAVGNGMHSQESILQAILIGQATNPVINTENVDLTAEEKITLENVIITAPQIFDMTHISPGPVPISEFCSNPENINLRGICK